MKRLRFLNPYAFEGLVGEVLLLREIAVTRGNNSPATGGAINGR